MNIGKIQGICSCCGKKAYSADPIILERMCVYCQLIVCNCIKQSKIPIFDTCDACGINRKIWLKHIHSNGLSNQDYIDNDIPLLQG